MGDWLGWGRGLWAGWLDGHIIVVHPSSSTCSASVSQEQQMRSISYWVQVFTSGILGAQQVTQLGQNGSAVLAGWTAAFHNQISRAASTWRAADIKTLTGKFKVVRSGAQDRKSSRTERWMSSSQCI